MMKLELISVLEARRRMTWRMVKEALALSAGRRMRAASTSSADCTPASYTVQSAAPEAE